MSQNLLPILLLLVLLLGGGYLLVNKKLPSTNLPSLSVTSSNINIEALKGFNPPLGNPDAPVKIIEFSDFQCPFCKKLHFEVFKEVKKDYIDKGLAVWYYRDFAILGEESINASLASRCAREQGKYWEYVDLLFLNQGEKGVGSFSKENLISFAKSLNLDIEKFKECLESKKYLNEIQEDINAAINLKVRGTPFVIINNDIIEGAYPYETFQKTINKYLTK